MPMSQRLSGSQAAWRSDFYLRLGRRIRRARTRAGFSQVALATACGFKDNGCICRIEKGEQRTDAHMVMAFADALGVSVAELFPRHGLPADIIQRAIPRAY